MPPPCGEPQCAAMFHETLANEAFSAVLCFSSHLKLTSISDKTAAPAGSTVICQYSYKEAGFGIPRLTENVSSGAWQDRCVKFQT